MDASDAGAAVRGCAEAGVEATDVLVTHHHGDHTAGIGVLKARYGCRVYSPEAVRVAGTDAEVSDGQSLVFGDWTVRVLATPGHTRTGVCYFCTHPAEPPVLYSGDTLFSGGCGRLFEGTAEMMVQSLRHLAELPDETRVYPGHDYTEENLRFALTIEPDNAAVREALAAVNKQTAFVPTTLAMEKQINVFLRINEPSIRRAAGASDPVEVFAELRRRKDRF